MDEREVDDGVLQGVQIGERGGGVDEREGGDGVHVPINAMALAQARPTMLCIHQFNYGLVAFPVFTRVPYTAGGV